MTRKIAVDRIKNNRKLTRLGRARGPRPHEQDSYSWDLIISVGAGFPGPGGRGNLAPTNVIVFRWKLFMLDLVQGVLILSREYLPYRKSIRLQEFDYSQPGAYFITICTYKRAPILSRILEDNHLLKTAGEIIRQTWKSIPNIYADVQVDEFVIMPNHFHGIIIMKDCDSIPSTMAGQACVGAGSPGPPKNPQGFLGKIIGRFKYMTTRDINISQNSPGRKVWQRNYYEHVIRNEEDMRICREYIANNPAKWQIDRYYGASNR